MLVILPLLLTINNKFINNGRFCPLIEGLTRVPSTCYSLITD